MNTHEKRVSKYKIKNCYLRYNGKVYNYFVVGLKCVIYKVYRYTKYKYKYMYNVYVCVYIHMLYIFTLIF